MSAGPHTRPDLDDDGFADLLTDLWVNGGEPALFDGSAALDEATAAVTELSPRKARPWRATARPVQVQLAESLAIYTVFLAGRGAGKTHAAANSLVEWIEDEPGDYAIVAPTFGDCRSICVEGPSGFQRAAGDALASYDKSKFEITMANGSKVFMASDDAPARLRGKNLTGVWADEVGSWRNIRETWEEGVEFATRIGRSRRLITTTPKMGNKIIKELHDRGRDGDPDVLLLRGATLDNAENLSQVFLDTIQRRYAGTTLGAQELEGILLNEVPGALLTGAEIEAARVRAPAVPELSAVVVAVDPAVSNDEGSDRTGIVVVGRGSAPTAWITPSGLAVLQHAEHLYVLEDRSARLSAEGWSRRALDVADEWEADRIVAEVNQGGNLVETTIRLVAAAEGRHLPPVQQVYASRSKAARADPVAALVQQGRMHMVGSHTDLEDEWTTWVPSETPKSPDRLDANVWGAVGLMPELAMKRIEQVAVLAGG